MSDLRRAAEMALEALERTGTAGNSAKESIAIQALRRALAQQDKECLYPECETGIGCDGPCGEKPVDIVNTSQEPVDEIEKRRHELGVCQHSRYSVDVHEQTGNCYDCGAAGRMKFVVDDTAPPKRKWKGLTSDDKHFLLANAWNKEQAFDGFMEAIDRFLEEKNT